jgi:hypothetical protein
MQRFESQGGEPIYYFASCGHTVGQEQPHVYSGIPTCAMQPSCHSIITGAHPCPLCAIGLRQPLTGEDLQQVSRMMDSLISQEDTFRLAVSERKVVQYTCAIA